MVFGDVTIKLAAVYPFNHRMLTPWINPNPPDSDGTVVLWDCSHSMQNKTSESKLIASALQCCTSTKSQWNVPSPYGTTALVDAANELHAKHIANVTKVIIVTDGEDTASKAERLIKTVLADGTSEFQEFRKTFMAATKCLTSEPTATTHISILRLEM